MRYAVLIEPVNESGFEGYYYAHVPSLDLTTHGQGIEGALRAAQELAEAWAAERRAHGEAVPPERNAVIAQIDIADAVLRS
jgi:predicted RNase H-like HicB family nuclease